MEKLSGEQLLQALRDAQERQFVTALQTVRATKAAEPDNIYLVAIEKEVARLADLSLANLLSEDEGIEIMETLPELVNRALQKGPEQHGHGPYNALSHRCRLSSKETHPAKENILSALKSQYFNRADDLIKKGDYQGALLEVRRIYVLDPSDHTARAYEQNIEKLTALQRREGEIGEMTFEPEHRTSEPEQVEATVKTPEPMRQEEVSTTVFSDSLLRDMESPSPKPRRHRPSGAVLVFLAVWALIGIGWLYMLITRANSRETPAVPTHEQNQPATRDSKLPNRENSVKQTQQSSEPVKPQTLSEKPNSGKPQVEAVALTVDDPANGVNGESATDVVPGVPEKVSTDSESDAGDQLTEKKTHGFSLKPLLPAYVKLAATSGREKQTGEVAPQLEIPEKEPQILRLEQPKLSDIALKNGMEGEVTVQVQIDPQGNPLRARILKSTNEYFDTPVIDAVMQSKYSPGVMRTGPVTTWITIPFKFQN